MRTLKPRRLCVECGQPATGRRYRCKPCWLDRRRELGIAKNRRHRSRHPDRVRERRRRYLASENGKRTRRASRKRWKSNRRAHLNAYERRRAKNNPASIKKARMKYEQKLRQRPDYPAIVAKRCQRRRERYAEKKRQFQKENPLWGYGLGRGSWMAFRRQQSVSTVHT